MHSLVTRRWLKMLQANEWKRLVAKMSTRIGELLEIDARDLQSRPCRSRAGTVVANYASVVTKATLSVYVTDVNQ